MVEQQHLFEERARCAEREREMATRRSYFTTTGRQRQQIGGLRRRRSNRGVGVRNNNINNNKNVFDESSTTTETSSNYEEEDNERKKFNVAIVGAGFAGLSCAYNVIRRCSSGEFISSTKSKNDGVNVDGVRRRTWLVGRRVLHRRGVVTSKNAERVKNAVRFRRVREDVGDVGEVSKD